MLSRDSCLQPDTPNSFGTSGSVFEDLPASSEPPAACFGNARSLTDTHCEPVGLNTGRLPARTDDTEIGQEVSNLESFISCRRSLSAQLHG